MCFSEKIKSLRKEQGLSQAELAKALNIGRSCLSMLEIGKNEPTVNNLTLFANFFEVSIDYLVGRSDDFGNVTITNSAGEQLTDEERAMLANYRRLNKLNRMHADSYILVRLENQEESASNRRG